MFHVCQVNSDRDRLRLLSDLAGDAEHTAWRLQIGRAHV
mgnify:CR=1 FL=1